VFGVAKAAGKAQHTATGFLKGKYAYMSPEQAEGEEIDHRSDIFALGIIFWELLADRRLFKGENDVMTMRLVKACQVPPPSKLSARVPAALDEIVLKALSKDPATRFAGAIASPLAHEDFTVAQHMPAEAAPEPMQVTNTTPQAPAHVAPRPPVPVRLTSDPLGARVEIAGREVGVTPVDYALTADAQPVLAVFSKDGFEPAQANVS